jgi:hypothetical protein
MRKSQRDIPKEKRGILGVANGSEIVRLRLEKRWNRNDLVQKLEEITGLTDLRKQVYRAEKSKRIYEKTAKVFAAALGCGIEGIWQPAGEFKVERVVRESAEDTFSEWRLTAPGKGSGTGQHLFAEIFQLLSPSYEQTEPVFRHTKQLIISARKLPSDFSKEQRHILMDRCIALTKERFESWSIRVRTLIILARLAYFDGPKIFDWKGAVGQLPEKSNPQFTRYSPWLIVPLYFLVRGS